MLLEIVIGTLALTVAGSATGLLVYLHGGGTLPEDVLPSGALAFSRIDLDPSAGQKLEVYAIARDFPNNRVRGSDTLKDDLLGALFAGGPIDYDRDIAPWLGDRAGVAVVPSPDGPSLLGALQYRDADRARAGLARIDGAAFRFLPDSDYVLLGTSPQVLQAAVAADRHLSDDPAYTEAVEDLDGDQIAIAWGDVRRIVAALPGTVSDRLAKVLGVGLQGSIVLGARVTDGVVEIQGRVSGLPEEVGLLFAGRTAGTALAGRLPANVTAAASVTNLGASLERAFDDLVGALPGVLLRSQALAVGLSLPQDLVALLGAETAVALLDSDRLGARLRGGDVALAKRAFRLFGGSPELVHRTSGGVVAALDKATLAALTEPGSELRDSERYQRAVPDADRAGLIVYADLPAVVSLFSPEIAALLGPARSAGLTVATEGGAQYLRLRVVFG